eukprot:4956485-Prymnesium_polylepis.1
MPEPNHAPGFPDCTNRPGSPDARGDAREVELDTDGEVDALDNLDARAVLAVEHVEEVVVLLLEL